MPYQQLFGDTNPGDPAHWLRGRLDGGATRELVSRHEDNPRLYGEDGWTAEGLAYLARLDRLTGTRRKRLRDGIWAAGAGAWFGGFDPDMHVSDVAEFDPRYPVHLAVDTGLHVGAVWFQVRGEGDDAELAVFGDYYAEDVAAYSVALAILDISRTLCNGRFDSGTADPAGGARTGLGVTHFAEYQRAGLRLNPWPKYPGCIVAGLTLVESFLETTPSKLVVHPRCVRMINALANYRRAERNGHFVDEPEPDQHPHGELIDALRSGLLARFPEGRRPEPKLRRVPYRKLF
jgi:hypothetical protein